MHQRYQGAAPARFASRGTIAFAGPSSRLVRMRQEAPLRFLRPSPDTGEPVTVVLVNTAGGVVGGDCLSTGLAAEAGAAVLATGQAAEKVYRSDGRTAMLATTLAADGGAALEVLPQGTILFDGARLSRRTRLYCDAGSIMLYGEILHLGRGAMGERFRRGSLIDRTEIICDGRLLFLDALRLDEATMAAMTALSGLGGADTVAVLYLLSQAGDRHLDAVRALLQSIADPSCRSAAAHFRNGPLVVRWIGCDAATLRHGFGVVWQHLRATTLGRPMRLPRLWST